MGGLGNPLMLTAGPAGAGMLPQQSPMMTGVSYNNMQPGQQQFGGF